jgi:hypothetical protein
MEENHKSPWSNGNVFAPFTGYVLPRQVLPVTNAEIAVTTASGPSPAGAAVSDAGWPGIKKRKISQDKNPIPGRFDFEIAYFRPSGINIPFIPAINDFLYLPAMPLISEGHGTLIDLITAVTLNLYSFVIHLG